MDDITADHYSVEMCYTAGRRLVGDSLTLREAKRLARREWAVRPGQYIILESYRTGRTMSASQSQGRGMLWSD